MKKIFIMIIVSICMLGGVSFAEEAMKIGYVDMRGALNDSKAGKEAKVTLEKIIKDKQLVLDAEKKKLEEMQQDFEKKASLLSDKAKQEKQKEFQGKVQAYQKMVADAQKEINEKEAEVTEMIINEIKKVIQDIAKEENYSLIFEKTEVSVLFGKEGLDLTNKVIQKYNAK